MMKAPPHRLVPRYPVSWLARQHVRKGDVRRDTEEMFFVLESGVKIFLSVADLREFDTTGYVEGAQPIAVDGLGNFQWDPLSVAADDGVYVIRPTVGSASTGPGRWVRPMPAPQVNGPGFQGTRLYALADHVHPMNVTGGAQVLTTVQRLALVATSGTLVFDTDLLKLFVWDGTVWVEV